MRRALAWAASGLLLVALGACTDETPVAKPAASASAGAVAPSASAVPVVTRTVDAAGDVLGMSVGPLVRSGGAVVLTVQTRLERSATGGASVVGRHFSSILTNSFDAVRLVDESGRRVYLVSEGRDGGNCVCTGLVRFEVGETRPLQAVFAGVPADVERVSVMLPYAGVFTDVPVVDGSVPAPPAGRTKAGDVQEPLDPATAAPAFTAALDSYTERLDVALRTRRTEDQVDISLDTDVLFRLDSAKLTPAAGKSIAAAVADLRAAGPGPLNVTGHTDNTGSTAHNQALSQQRAQAVAGALRKALPDGEWPKTVAAKGESEPAVANDSDAHRALNRRVAITYQTRAQAAAPPVPTRAVLPKTKGKQGRAPDGVEVAMPLNRGTIRFVPGAATVRGPFLLVPLTARNTGGTKATILDFLGQGVFTVRDEFDPYARYGTAGVRLLQGDTAAYGLDYETAPGDHRCLCDRILSTAIPPGSEQVLSLWFPAPPPGTPTVTLDVPNRLRITDIPIS
ncbi:OmpA family protein [Actinoplanes sp. NPDC049599]|uniref:OmpA family protein n=1 Tax=Actinoplanes sp. NPDC049599 TaxID=3363903 RepID=UPI0037906297